MAELAAELEWILAQNQLAPKNIPMVEFKKPSYFNTGCCAFLDGDVTGLEFSDGEIRLVRWPDDEDRPHAQGAVHSKIERCICGLLDEVCLRHSVTDKAL